MTKKIISKGNLIKEDKLASLTKSSETINKLKVKCFLIIKSENSLSYSNII